MNLKRLSFLVLPVLLAACGNYVVEGGSDDNAKNQNANGTSGSGGNGGTGGNGTGGDSDGPDSLAVALTRAQLDVLWDEYWANHDPSGSSSSAGGVPELNPDDLFLRISDLGASCNSPTTDLGCGHWQLSIALPPALQQVGVYNLDSPELLAYSHFSETGEPYSPAPDDCSFGGGTIGAGTLEILSIDENEVHFRIDAEYWGEKANGEYIAPRCPVAP
ncbi:hypothetical protein [Polyangium jinanense]|uniref:Lipoprotein n=1 Tax=Polyangium jinanense TaxID=2829994 RepID=A0A9X3XHB7_9BACT|nr:hypothetical protein [Polyangium jinanense]MDC3960259.1 hypothetical protein [Polyangium jinanense]MDC3988021.1 hypothetical protein [Polyangium jinanense]